MRTGNPRWKERVWQQIDRRASLRRAWWIGGGMVAAAAAALVLWLVLRPAPSNVVASQPELHITSAQVAMRSTSARVRDTLWVSPPAGEEVRFYRAELLVSRCAAGAARCELTLATAGEYQVVYVTPGAPPPSGTLDRDTAAVISSGGDYKIAALSVR